MIFCFFKKKKDPIAWFEGEDSKMLEAIALVRSSFGKFVATALEEGRRAVLAFDAPHVKYAFPATTMGLRWSHHE